MASLLHNTEMQTKICSYKKTKKIFSSSRISEVFENE